MTQCGHNTIQPTEKRPSLPHVPHSKGEKFGFFNSHLPRKGWELQGVEDLLGPHGTCDWCGTTIRYVHHLTHPNGHETTSGCICSGHLCGDFLRSETLEKATRSRSARLETWLKSPRWKLSQNGNIYRRDQGTFVLIFAQKNQTFGLKIGETWGTRDYANTTTAKVAAFNALNAPP